MPSFVPVLLCNPSSAPAVCCLPSIGLPVRKCVFESDQSMLCRLYSKENPVMERHRHRYEVNTDVLKPFAEKVINNQLSACLTTHFVLVACIYTAEPPLALMRPQTPAGLPFCWQR